MLVRDSGFSVKINRGNPEEIGIVGQSLLHFFNSIIRCFLIVVNVEHLIKCYTRVMHCTAAKSGVERTWEGGAALCIMSGHKI